MSASPNSTTFAGILTASFSRPADTNVYASGDLVANSTTAGSVVPLSWPNASIGAGTVIVRAVRIRKTGTGTTNASFRLHLFTASPTSAAGDNAAFSTAGAAGGVARFDVTTDAGYSDGANGRGISMSGNDVTLVIPSGNTLFGLLEARGAYTPASGETFTVILEVLRLTP